MHAPDLFTCVDELLANALKKSPAPSVIRVSEGSSDPKRASLEVWDDGHHLKGESDESRPGAESGLDRLRKLLEPYAGTLELRDAPDGGVTAEIRVPRFDLD